MELHVNEIFYSLQGEGARMGIAHIFIRLQGCKVKHACLQYGVQCDTEFESGKSLTLEAILKQVKKFPCKNILWTGGEPAQQLKKEHLDFFKKHHFFQMIETSGAFPLAQGLDYIVVSPKVGEHVLVKNISQSVQELKYVRFKGQEIPKPQLKATHYFISPHFDGNALNKDNLKHCIALCLQNPKWRLSMQLHKLWEIR